MFVQGLGREEDGDKMLHGWGETIPRSLPRRDRSRRRAIAGPLSAESGARRLFRFVALDVGGNSAPPFRGRGGEKGREETRCYIKHLFSLSFSFLFFTCGEAVRS